MNKYRENAYGTTPQNAGTITASGNHVNAYNHTGTNHIRRGNGTSPTFHQALLPRSAFLR